VAGIAAADGACVRVRVGDVWYGRVHLDDWERLGLQHVGQLDPGLWPGLREALARRAAYEHGLRLLAARDRSRRELARRLARQHGEAAVEDALGRLAAYLDDERFARAWVEARQRAAPVGPAALEAGLLRLGVATDLARRVVAAHCGDSAGESPQQACARAAAAWLRRGAGTADGRWRERLYAHLRRRGFGHGVVVRVLAIVGTDGGAAGIPGEAPGDDPPPLAPHPRR
jgi:regulatory protein